jgi:sugar phosphate isomerase/epimerase
LPVFQGTELAATKRELSDRGLVISCLDTSCLFHSPDSAERNRWLVEGTRMSDLAVALGAPGIRVFGDTIQPGVDRDSTRGWIAESICKLAEITAPKGVEVWLESHGDFAAADETLAVLKQAGVSATGVLWDPANSFTGANEAPADGAEKLGAKIRHTHIKDLRKNKDTWEHVLTGEGGFPLRQQMAALRKMNYDRFVSFEWEKKWHPEIPDAEIALPHFIRWFRQN